MLTHCADDGDKKARSPGRVRGKPLKPLARGKPDDPDEPVVTSSCAFYFCIRGCGCIWHPAFPAPSVLFEGNAHAKLAQVCGEIAKLRLRTRCALSPLVGSAIAYGGALSYPSPAKAWGGWPSRSDGRVGVRTLPKKSHIDGAFLKTPTPARSRSPTLPTRGREKKVPRVFMCDCPTHKGGGELERTGRVSRAQRSMSGAK
jgi:hypothetical protein